MDSDSEAAGEDNLLNQSASTRNEEPPGRMRHGYRQSWVYLNIGKIVIVFLLVAGVCVAVIALLLDKDDLGFLIGEHDKTRLTTLYSEYLAQHSKSESRLQDPNRGEIFRQNWNKFLIHNERYKNGWETWSMIINKFTDMTEEEIKNNENHEYNEVIHTYFDNYPASTPHGTSSDIPESLDYRKRGAMTPVRDEGNCASSFVFAAVASMESRHALLTGNYLDLSEQHILDCVKRLRSNGCDGGSFRDIFDFLQNKGVDTEAHIPYKAEGGRRCPDPQRKYYNRIPGWAPIEQDEEAMRRAIAEHGPIVASVTVDREFFSYGGGVFTNANNGQPNHAVLIYGYDTVDGRDVWLIKNSWGVKWGEQGLMKMQRNVNLRQIASGAYAIVDSQRAESRGVKAVSMVPYALYLVVIKSIASAFFL